MSRLAKVVKERFFPLGTWRRGAVDKALRRFRSWRAHRLLPPPPGVDLASIAMQASPRVLHVSGCGGDSRRYRCEHARLALDAAGAFGTWIDADHPQLTKERLALVEAFDLFVLQRVSWSPAMARLVEAARARGRPVWFETDDLTFDESLGLHDRPGSLLTAVGVRGQRECLESCDGAIASTESLAAALRALGKEVFVWRNGFSAPMRRAAEVSLLKARREPAKAEVVLGYASGTPTHDRDFASMAVALEAVMGRFPQTRLVVIGPLSLPASLREFGDRVQRHPFVPWVELPGLLAGFDINLAPLEDSAFNRAKSAIKFMEAALVGVPTVATDLASFREAIRDGETGLLARDRASWESALGQLIESPEQRAAMGEAARQAVLARDGLEARGRDLLGHIQALCAASLGDRGR